MKECKDCIWRDECGTKRKKACEYYEPVDSDELRIEGYERTLKERGESYQDLMDENNGEGRQIEQGI